MDINNLTTQYSGKFSQAKTSSKMSARVSQKMSVPDFKPMEIENSSILEDTVTIRGRNYGLQPCSEFHCTPWEEREEQRGRDLGKW